MSTNGHLFQGFSSPNTTQVPDELFDQLMPILSGAELKVLLYIVRRTFGFKKETDNISLSQLVNGITTRDGRKLDGGTGLSKAAVANALKILTEKGIVLAVRNRSLEKGNEPTTYQLRFSDPLSKNWTRGSPNNGQALVQKLDTQHTVRQETVEQQHGVVVDQLVAFGITKAVADRLVVGKPEDYVLGKLDLVQWLVDIKSKLVGKNPAGYLRRAIEDDYQPLKGYQTPEQRESIEQAKSQRQKQEQEMRARLEETFKIARAATRKTVAEQFPPQPIAGTAHTTQTLWRSAVDEFKHQMTEANFQTWLRDTSLISCDHTTAVIVAPNAWHVQFLEQRFNPLISKTLFGLLGYKVACQFVAVADLPTSEPSENHHEHAPPPQLQYSV